MASLTETETESKKYLFIDDAPEYLRVYRKILRDAGHTMEIIDNIGLGWVWIERHGPFELVLIDLALDRHFSEFGREYKEVREGLESYGHGALFMTGQALGLRLWRRRKKIQQPYCYFTNFSQIWVENCNTGDPEFGGMMFEEAHDLGLVLNKSALWEGNMDQELRNIRQIWEDKEWLL
ncbi:MAG: hypothetical protein BECKG1743D_GA0114223_101551 [Candidatus Kentron sp. G]|nr:MAG: hypothetical protein BECKG1743F_GA0114225_101181 [Candidatus Kentron sp. G]VFM97465.1 MAG: hypothetical protein BECKG1743E_GA0114224_101331 [Candidatus Kentron sp. G]VFM99889.1 MAG: hypothetical protein BECKG1743D_GA0114223_101551 [Candidatus Kentron sp. G]